MSLSARILCFTGPHATQPLRAEVSAHARILSGLACCWVRADHFCPAVSTVQSEMCRMYQTAPVLAGFSPIDHSITARLRRSGIRGPILCIGMGAILRPDEV